jgi:hypothetical protein
MSSLVLAALTNDKSEINLKNTISIDDSYVKVNTNSKSLNALNTASSIQKADTYLTTFKLTDKKIDTTDTTVSIYQNNLDSITETVISNKDMIVKLNSKTGELISYISNETNFEKNTLSEKEIEKKALKILKNIANPEEYELILLEQFDDEIYRVKFSKKYGEHVNPGELISFSFAPQTSEIITFAQKSVPFANNQVILTEENARQIAEQYLDKSKATAISSVSLEIVKPNSGLEQPLTNGQLYIKSQETRLAYVFTFNNSARTKIFIDSTTGQAIGMDKTLGGDF